MLYLLLVLSIFVIGLLVWLWRWECSSFVRQIDRIPGPPKVPFFGNVFAIPRDGSEFLHTLHVKWVRKYGRIYRTWKGTSAIVSISSPQHVERLLTSQKNIDKSSYYAFLEPWLENGLLLSSGEKWKKDRRLVTPAFHFQILGDFFDVFNRNAVILIDQIVNRLVDSKEMDIFPLISRCTLDIISEAAMGIKINTQIDSDSEYIKAVDRVQEMTRARFYSAEGLLPDWIYFLLTRNGRKHRKYIQTLHAFSMKVLRERKAQLEFAKTIDVVDVKDTSSTKARKRRPFLDLLLETAREGADLSEADILSQVDNFMFAGHDTTSTAITWFLYCMATHPDEQERVYEEIQECFGNSDRSCALEDLRKLKYLECCMKESIRLHPSVANFRRQISEQVQLDDYTIPVGASISVQIYALHHNEELFADPLSFKPERFQVEQSIGRHPFAFIPFSAGPRNCIGQKYAVYEEKAILVALLRKFHFTIDARHRPIKETHGIIMKPANGMPLLITLR
ncbi:cytochrome P450 4C1 isoform X1 [Daphnia magna]|uniref:cytochrome P450 4C1 isoform X1 n=1 Tax=Daphnia magna TaxID=35525 RepID=UPI001E1BB2ED|nr:cytochrome P450 4C1 isoform X1 [Daphnia magna]XP_045033406.1 cytochrome P450 4C1 isoform X1 [Daphnia magna]XP_045033407.1 cytochrome P450 4C1 isoform X1 [Daphnia magna]XP_045033408.1 cytochrome P450 4C1 isoform X1 [Daphnia magna]XP_045033409.1 cytochrome P450 4C1 isoform X1 [Daphnia magna]XP_045033410.1 cytochrome P450 4C1 isoform X1 [Daphnia magna]XP_045033411.1 cytochrome P450 4C1 isoform X1 [Daphnia magna]